MQNTCIKFKFLGINKVLSFTQENETGLQIVGRLPQHSRRRSEENI
jgi:hypothetical protein